MNQVYRSILCNDLSLVGRKSPKSESDLEAHEPFWHQCPPCISLGRPSSYISLLPTNDYFRYAMDFETIVIGSNTKNGRRIPEGSKKPSKLSFQNGYQNRNKNNRPPLGKVRVYIDGEFIQEAPLGLLVRFSTTARIQFPNPASSGPSGDGELQKSDGPGQLTSGTDKLEKASKSRIQDASIQSAMQMISPHNFPPKKIMDIQYVELGFWRPPPVEALKFAFAWMERAKETARGEIVLDYGFETPSRHKLSTLVDLYAAALTLRLRPAPHKLRLDIYHRLTTQPPLIGDIIYIHEHIPIDDGVVTRMITSFIQHRGARAGKYSKRERDEIEDYLYEEDEDLYDRFKAIELHLQRKREDRKRENFALLPQMMPGSSQTDGGASSNRTAKVEEPGPKAEAGGRRRMRRKQGKGVAGIAALETKL